MKRLENLYVNFTPSDRQHVGEALATQSISGDSPPVVDFERQVNELFGTSEAVAVCSGTVSIYCALHALGIGPGDEVVLPPTAVIMSALPVIQLGATVRFVDTEANGLGVDASDLKAVLTERTKAVISVPMWGYPVPMEGIVEVCASRGVALIEDVSQSHATTWNGRLLGTFGVVGCLSTQERKLITTGEGGVLITNERLVADQARTLRRYGLEPDDTIGRARGLNFKMSAASAAAGTTQVAKLREKISLRGRVAQAIRDGIRPGQWFEEIAVPSHSTQNYYALCFRVTDGSRSATKLGDHLAQRLIISDPWRYHYAPLYNFPLLASSARQCPSAEALISTVFTLPCHEGMDDEDVERVVRAVNEFAG